MKNYVFIVVLGLIFCGLVLGVESPDMSSFEGREVILRIFKDWRERPADYEQRGVKVSGRSFRLDFEGVDDSSVVTVFGHDQEDDEIKKLVGNSVWGWLYRPGYEVALPREYATDVNDVSWTFVDAFGDPISGGSVELYLEHQGGRVFVDGGQVDDEGVFVTKYRISYRRAKIGISSFGSIAAFLLFKHPDYGISEAKVYRGVDRRDGHFVTLSLVPLGSEAYTRCAWGQVVDPNGKGVGGASVGVAEIIPPGGESIRRRYNSSVRTDEQGRFRIYMPTEPENEKIGTLIPANTDYYLSILPPVGSGLLPLRERASNREFCRITLERPERYYRSFSFEDKSGPVTDRLRLYSTRIAIVRGDKPNVILKYDDFKRGGNFPLGIYKATMPGNGDNDYKFEPINVTADSPEHLRFMLPSEYKFYHGQVVHGITGEPMAGAFVLDSISMSGGTNLSTVTDEQWKELHELPRAVSLGEKASLFTRLCYSSSRIVRSDEEGNFELKIPPAHTFYKVVIFEKDFLTVITDHRECKSEGENRFVVPLTRLFPAAKVVVETWAKEPENSLHPALWVEWIIKKPNNPEWIERLLSNVQFDNHLDGIRKDFLVHLNRKRSFFVPAGITMCIQLRPRYGDIEDGWAPMTVAGKINLEQGQLYDLGRHQIHKMIPIFVDVVTSKGTRVEGVPVKAIDQYGSVTRHSDEEGIAIFSLAPDSKGRFIVDVPPKGVQAIAEVRESVVYEIKGSEDANSVFTVKVSDEHLKRLFE
ncbi:MAG: carboxypeptidase-like regulatory domain-containing protein [Planctomycetota bacterium]|jgi:hypothetical protein